MAKKKVLAVVKIQIPAGSATPAPPVGTALGPHGVAIMDFCKEYNARTEAQRGTIIPVEITVFEDRSFTFITKTPPTPVLIREAAGTTKVRPRHEYEISETVRVKEGPFSDFSGQIVEINEDQLKVKVLVNIFGRETPVELDFSQVAKL